MKKHNRTALLVLLSSLLALGPPVFAQGKGQEHGKGHGQEAKGNKQERGKNQKAGPQKENKDKGAAVARGKGNEKDDRRAHTLKAVARDDDRIFVSSRGDSRRFKRVVLVDDMKPNLRRFAISKRAPERVMAGALSRGIARGLRDDDVVIRPNGNGAALFNRSGLMLLDLDDERARKLGGWRVVPYDHDVKSGAPSFCRSGAGHPVFGRDWCLDKGFGLGEYRDLRWGRTTDVGDILLRRQMDSGTLARSVLLDVLGDVAFNRLGLHALTLGYSDPLTGTWYGEPSGPHMLRVTSGAFPIAEIYDADRDNRADVLVVALRPW
jgi:hypothetical protein